MSESISLSQCLNAFIEDCRTRHYSRGTLAGYRKDIRVFIDWAWRHHYLYPEQLTAAVLSHYQQYLLTCQTRHGTVLKPSTRKTYLMRLQVLLHWLTRQGLVLCHLTVEALLPRTGKTLPKVLSVQAVERLIQSVNVHAPYGVRDRAILETLYSTGMRGMEASRLTLDNLSLDSGWVTIRQGKGKKDRRIPLGDSAVDWLQQYLNHERPRSKRAKEYRNVFLNAQSYPYQSKGISALVHRYLRQSGVSEHGGSHLLRHSMATHMLQNGADIRVIQIMLGHSHLASTQIYTQVQDPALKAVHTDKHPARLTQS